MAWEPKATVRPHPFGETGINSSLEETAKRAAGLLASPEDLAKIRTWAIEKLDEARKKGRRVASPRDRVEVLLQAVQQKLWVPDPIGIEYIPGAHLLACDENKDGAVCVKGDDCFAQGTLVLAEGHELVPVEQLKPGMKIWGLDRWSVVQDAWYKGVLPISVVELNNGGQLRLTEDHHVYVLDCPRHALPSEDVTTSPCACPVEERVERRIKVSELKPGMVMPRPERLPFGDNSSPDAPSNQDQALIEGLYVSDGWADREKNNRFFISGQDGCPKEEQKREVQQACERLGVETTWFRKYITIRNKDWALRVQHMGCHAPQKHLLTLNLDEALAAASLRGVMADSGKNTKGRGSTFTTTSYQLFVQTRVLHRMFGISCGSYFIQNHGGLGENPIWRLATRRPQEGGPPEWLLRVKEVHRNAFSYPCWDITTDDHRVYLPEHDVTVSQCDGLVVLLAACLLAVGVYCMVAGHSYNGDTLISHVLVKAYYDGDWHYADPSPLIPAYRHMPLGTCAPFTRERCYSLPEVKVICDGATCKRNFNPTKEGFVKNGNFVGVSGVVVEELPPELLPRQAQAYPFAWLGGPQGVGQTAQTEQRISNIEKIMFAGVVISAASLATNWWWQLRQARLRSR